jgi:hypothetical protein
MYDRTRHNDSDQKFELEDSAVISLPSFLPQAYRAKKGLLSSSLDVLPVVQAQRTASQMDLVESDPFEGLQSRAALRSMLQWELVESPLTAVRNSGLIWKGWTSVCFGQLAVHTRHVGEFDHVRSLAGPTGGRPTPSRHPQH